ncbi:hypothetical protein ACFRQM_35885 [Streptomyces sp. NPDC056831]|uniref:hypothetical protein n=1 Tax=Streptomyces sp. NPDC056831 TaxID=3345954 RepID=UPI0036A9D062
MKFTAAERAAAAAGWQYTMVTGWRHQAWTGLESLSARRRAMSDPLDLIPELLNLTRERPRRPRPARPAPDRCAEAYAQVVRGGRIDEGAAVRLV